MNMIHFILGQTATGKTARAVRLAHEIDGELINCDSRQIYKELNIITGKTDNPPDIPTHLVDIADISQRYSAHEYALQARAVIADILARGKSPIIVGGTGLYAHYLLHVKESIVTSYKLQATKCVQSERDVATQTALTGLTAELSARNQLVGSVQELQQEIYSIDPAALTKLNQSDRANPHRLLSLLHKLQNPTYVPPLSDQVTLFPDVPKSITVLLHSSTTVTHDRLSARVASRLAQGAVEECQTLLTRGYTPDMSGLQALGYTQLFAYLNGDLPIKRATEQWLVAEYQYAKRQKTYFKKYFPTAEIVTI